MTRYTSRTGAAAALERWAHTDDRAAATAPARDAAFERFLRQADPGGKLSKAERTRRAKMLERAHMLRMVEARQARRSSPRSAA